MKNKKLWYVVVILVILLVATWIIIGKFVSNIFPFY